MPSQTFTHTATAVAPITSVWASLDQPQTWESIGGVDRVYEPQLDDSGRLRGFSFDTEVAGKSYRGQALPGRREEARAMAWNIRNSEVTGVLDVELDESNSGTEITVTISVASASFISGMFFPAIAGAIGKGLPRAVDDFARSFSD